MSKDSAAIRQARALEEQGINIIIGTPSIFELFVGVVSAKRPVEEEAKITNTLASHPHVSLDYAAAREAGTIYAEKKRLGQAIDSEDAMLAGIARVKAEKILTRNIKHFSDINGVTIETY